jgi:hypothetical protein
VCVCSCIRLLRSFEIRFGSFVFVECAPGAGRKFPFLFRVCVCGSNWAWVVMVFFDCCAFEYRRDIDTGRREWTFASAF